MYSSTCAELAIYPEELALAWPAMPASNQPSQRGDLEKTYLRNPLRGNERACFQGPYSCSSQAPDELNLRFQWYCVLLVL